MTKNQIDANNLLKHFRYNGKCVPGENKYREVSKFILTQYVNTEQVEISVMLLGTKSKAQYKFKHKVSMNRAMDFMKKVKLANEDDLEADDAFEEPEDYNEELEGSLKSDNEIITDNAGEAKWVKQLTSKIQ